jgi:hypothetical protein
MGKADFGKRFSWTTVQLLAPRAHQTMPGKGGNDMHPAVAMLLSMATITMMVMLLSGVGIGS